METLAQPARVDSFGGVVTWLETPLGRDIVHRVIPDPERDYRLPMLLRAAQLWEFERRQALARFKRSAKGRGARPQQ